MAGAQGGGCPDHWGVELGGSAGARAGEAERGASPLASPLVAEADGRSRRVFVCKVYALLSLQLIVAAVAAHFLSLHVEGWTWNWIVLVGGIGCVGKVVVCALPLSTSCPTIPCAPFVKCVLISVFTACQSLVVTCCCWVVGWENIGLAVLLTGLAIVGLALSALWFGDCEGCSFYAFVVLCALIAAASAFGVMRATEKEVTEWYMGAVLALVLLFSFSLMYAAQLTLGGRHEELRVDHYCFAALMVYRDGVHIAVDGVMALFKGHERATATSHEHERALRGS